MFVCATYLWISPSWMCCCLLPPLCLTTGIKTTPLWSNYCVLYSLLTLFVCVQSLFFTFEWERSWTQTGQNLSPIETAVCQIERMIYCRYMSTTGHTFSQHVHRFPLSLFFVFMTFHLVNRPQLSRLSSWWFQFSKLFQNAFPHACWACGERLPNSYNHSSPPCRGPHRG